MRQLKITKTNSNRENFSLEKYMEEIGSEELLTVEEEVELAKQSKKGDREALMKLVKPNLKFVVPIAKQYENQGISLPDLINEGNLGLIRAAEFWDETRGGSLISYAAYWIREAILQVLAEQNPIVRIPLNSNTSKKIDNAFSKV